MSSVRALVSRFSSAWAMVATRIFLNRMMRIATCVLWGATLRTPPALVYLVHHSLYVVRGRFCSTRLARRFL